MDIKVQDLKNYATEDNGCQVVECTSENLHGEAANVLNSNRKKLWMTTGPPPQSIIIDISNLESRPKECFNVIGVDCWYDYQTNPKEIQIFSSTDGRKFESEGRFICKQQNDWKFFPTRDISTRTKYLKLTVLSNFGDETTYLNQILLSYCRPQVAEIEKYLPTKEMVTEKSHLKLTSTEKELKRLLQRVECLESDNQKLKTTNKALNNKVSGMEEKLKSVLLEVQRLRGIVEESRGYSNENQMDANSKSKYSRSREPLPKVPKMSSTRHVNPKRLKQNTPSSDSELSKYEIRQQSVQVKKNDRLAQLASALQMKLMLKEDLIRKYENSHQRRRTSSDYERY